MVMTLLFTSLKGIQNHLHTETSSCITAGEVKRTHRVEQCHYPANHNWMKAYSDIMLNELCNVQMHTALPCSIFAVLSALFNETVHCSEYIIVMNEWISLEVWSNDTEMEEPRYAEKKKSSINPTWKCLGWKLVLRCTAWAMVRPNIFRRVW